MKIAPLILKLEKYVNLSRALSSRVNNAQGSFMHKLLIRGILRIIFMCQLFLPVSWSLLTEKLGPLPTKKPSCKQFSKPSIFPPKSSKLHSFKDNLLALTMHQNFAPFSVLDRFFFWYLLVNFRTELLILRFLDISDSFLGK